MHCATCEQELEAFTGDVCPHCHHFAHPTRLGIYENLELVKRGGMGSVYRARHPDLGTTVAIKTVVTHAGPDTMAERFELEASMAARIPHPGVVRVFDYDCQEGRLYLVMEFVDGATLRQHIQESGRDVAWCLDKVAQLAEIVQAAHDQGIIHRDIKPENVMVDTTGKVRVLDFGISRLLAAEERLTRTGEILGTPEYMAPEQILDAPDAVDARTDIYATGVVLYELLTGTSPFAGNNLWQVLKLVESRTPPPPAGLRVGVPDDIDALVMECIAKDKDKRPATARALARRLHGFAPGAAPPRNRTPAMIAIGVLAFCIGWACALALSDGDPVPVVADQPSAAAIVRRLIERPERRSVLQLQTAARAIADGAPREDRFWRGTAHKHSGALFSALRDYVHVRDEGRPEAGLQAAIVWMYIHRLYPEIVDGPRWLGMAADMPGFAMDTAEGDDFRRGLVALARNEYASAARYFADSRPDRHAPDRGVLAGLSQYLDGQFGSARRTVAHARTTHPDYVPLLLLHALFDQSTGDREVRVVLERMDRLTPMRYFLEAALAVRKDQESRLRAAVELATVAGEAKYATALFVAAKIYVGPGRSLPALQHMVEEQKQGAVLPGLSISELLLAQAGGKLARAGEILAAVPQSDDPRLEYYRAWAKQPTHALFYNGVAQMLESRAGLGRRTLLEWLRANSEDSTDEIQLSRLCVALTLVAPDDQTAKARVEQGLTALLRGGSELRGFEQHFDGVPFRLSGGVLTAVLKNVIAAGVEAKFDSDRFRAVLRVAQQCGHDLASLYAAHEHAALGEAAQAMTPTGGSGGK